MPAHAALSRLHDYGYQIAGFTSSADEQYRFLVWTLKKEQFAQVLTNNIPAKEENKNPLV